MMPSSPSFSHSSKIRRGPASPLSIIGTVLFAIVLVVLAYYIGREILLKGHALFEGGR